MENKLTNESSEILFGVPCIVVDNFLKIASGEQIKVLLYILRNNGHDIDSENISENTGISRKDVENAVSFWKNCNIIPPENNKQNAVSMNSMFTPVSALPETASQPPVQQNLPLPVADTSVKRIQLHPTEITEIINTNAEIAELFQVLQGIIPTINNFMQNSLIWIYNYYGLKREVIAILMSYCASFDKLNTNYIEKMAETWAEKGINTLEEAQKEVAFLSACHSYTYQIMNMFEMKRTPTTKQQKFIDEWYEKNFNLELIKYAYEKTVENIEKLSFPYINKILVVWQTQGLKTVEDVQNFEESSHKSYKQSKFGGNSDGFNAEDYNIVINKF